MNETKHFKQLLLPKGVELNKLLKQLLQMLQKHPSPWGVLIGFPRLVDARLVHNRAWLLTRYLLLNKYQQQKQLQNINRQSLENIDQVIFSQHKGLNWTN